MKPRSAPNFETRRAGDFEDQLVERARAWIGDWGFEDGERDFGRALLKIAALFSSEVAERLDQAGDKMKRGFLDWLAIGREAARPARLPVVFKMIDTAPAAVLAKAAVQMQVDVDGAPVVLETEQDVNVLPGRLMRVIGVDADQDAFYASPPGFTSLDPLDPVPTEWRVRTFAAGSQGKLQVDPELGLVQGLIVSLLGKEYEIQKVDKDIVTLDPLLPAAGVPPDTVMRRVDTFAPFESGARNLQEHAIYLGDTDLLNVGAAATIEIVGAQGLRTAATWQYWGKLGEGDEVGWQDLPLAKEQEADGVTLDKPAGAIEPRKICAIESSRWIRGWMKTVKEKTPRLVVDGLRLRVNCVKGGAPCPPPAGELPGAEAQAMANTTPLVLSAPFYPLGREPKQFDAFYLGSAEAFSKKNAKAQVCIEMADATCAAFAAVRGGVFANRVLAGVGADRALHLFWLNLSGEMKPFLGRGPLRPPLPADALAAVPPQAQPVGLNTRCTPVIWTILNDFYVAVAAGGQIWVWHEVTGDPKKSGWQLHSTIPDSSGRTAQIEDLVLLLNAPTGPSAALSNGRLWIYKNSAWKEPLTPPAPGTPLQDFAVLVPVRDAAGNATQSVLAVDTAGAMYRCIGTTGAITAVAAGVTVDFGDLPAGSAIPVGGMRPSVIDDGAGTLQIATVNNPRTQLVAVKANSATGTLIQQESIGLAGDALGVGIDTVNIAGKWQYSVGIGRGTSGALVGSWLPTFIAANPSVLLESVIPSAPATIGGTPITVGAHVIVPGGRADSYVARFNVAHRLRFDTKPIHQGVIVPGPQPFAVGDRLAVDMLAGGRQDWVVGSFSTGTGAEVVYPVDPALGIVKSDPQLERYRRGGTGRRNAAATEFTLDAADAAVVGNVKLRIELAGNVSDYDVSSVLGLVVTLQTNLPGAANAPLTYWYAPGIPSVARAVPAIEFVPWGDGNWDASILDHANVYVLRNPTPQPSPQTAVAFGVVGGHPTVVALSFQWTNDAPPLIAPTPFIIDGAMGAWQHQLADTAANPELSWEYWNGKGWWSLPVTDGTQRLASTGPVTFTVPTDIEESDWSGQKNFWIRARLVGGNYGIEDVKVITKPIGTSGETETTVVRSSENIKAPQILELHITYSICDEVTPTYVLASDSGTCRDQSDANRTPGAMVVAFVPLAITLGRLSGEPPTPSDEPCAPACNCGPVHGPVTTAAALTNGFPTREAHPATGRAIFLGSSAPLAQASVNVLVAVDREHDFEDGAPLDVSALGSGRFVSVVSSDTTRALGETGLLTLAFGEGTDRAALFGQTLHWLRLVPKPLKNPWNPTLRGAYLNAVWASATETLTRELLGSSEGAPRLVVRLARPPVLRDSLELRVREPLGQEELDELRAQDSANVVHIDEPPGDWVLWKKVPDPGDESPTARVYALDEKTGEIRFGDGLHGMIPPVGRDSIVAFRYARTEAPADKDTGVPANYIAARTKLNLVSPVESVEAVFAADHAAGGAPPESDERVLRFGSATVRHRGRAVTARDFEDIALQSSPDIVQARATLRGTKVRLLVVMRGANPIPDRAQVRELKRLLLAAAPAGLGPDALHIVGPKVRRIRVQVALRVASLDYAGALAKRTSDRLAAFMDTATGGSDDDGFPVGTEPRTVDLVRAFIDLPNVEGVARVNIVEVLEDGSTLAWTGKVKPNELVTLAKEAVRTTFEVVEAIA